MLFTLAVLLVIIVLAIAFPLLMPKPQKQYQIPRNYCVMFKPNLPKDTELKGDPRIFYARRRPFYVVGGYGLLLFFGMTALLIYCMVVYRNPYTLGLLYKMYAIFVALLLVTILPLINICFARFYLYANGFVWRSVFRRKTCFFHELDGLRWDRRNRLNSRARHSLKAYVFFKGSKIRLKLALDVYKDITLLEEVFNVDNPYVLRVQGQSLDVFG